MFVAIFGRGVRHAGDVQQSSGSIPLAEFMLMQRITMVMRKERRRLEFGRRERIGDGQKDNWRRTEERRR